MKIHWFFEGDSGVKYGILLATQTHSQELLVRKGTWLAATIETNPSENSNWRKHRNACPLYRKHWFPCNDVMADESMNHLIFIEGTPTPTLDEQERDLHNKILCRR